jgi:hypothetical protein
MTPRSFAMEHLEGRTLFCVAAPADTVPATSAAALSVIPQLTAAGKSPLTGAFNVSGIYAHPVGPLGNPDAGAQYTFNGSGKTTTLGKFTLTGHVQPPGFIANGQAAGRLVITTSKGVINLKVVGPPQSSGTLPPSLSFKIVSGTGVYATSSGKGTIVVSASGTTHKFLFRFNPPA